MTRYMIDCRKVPSENNCSLAIAGTEDEVLDAAAAHAVASHGHDNTPELRRCYAVRYSRRRPLSPELT